MRTTKCTHLVLVLLIALSPSYAWASQLESLLNAANQQRVYRQPAPAELQHAERLFRQTLEGAPIAQLQGGWQTLGFNLQTVFENGSTFYVLAEAEDLRYGRGFYLFQPSPQLAVALQATHRFRDFHTGKLVLSLAAHYRVAAAAWNTVPRSFKQNGRQAEADVAHLSNSYFLAFSRAFAAVYKTGYLMQVHGFAKRKRSTIAGAQADVIISSGSQAPSSAVLAASYCLKHMIPGVVHLYPQDVSELGGTMNTVGQALRQMGHDGFIHLELSKPMRERMLDQATLRHPILACLPPTRL